MKLLLDLPGQLGEELLVLDLLTMSISRVRAKRATACPDHARLAPVQTQTQEQAQSAAASPLEVDFDSLDDARTAGYDIVDIREQMR